MQVRLGVLKNWIALLQSCSRLAGVNYQSSSLWCQIRTLEHLRRSSLCQMVERIGEVENHQQKVDAPCTDFVISEKVVECTERTEWAQGLNLEALQTEGQLGQTESCLRRWFADGLKGMTKTSWEQNQKYQSNFGDDLEKCCGRSCQMHLTGPIRSEQKLVPQSEATRRPLSTRRSAVSVLWPWEWHGSGPSARSPIYVTSLLHPAAPFPPSPPQPTPTTSNNTTRACS